MIFSEHGIDLFKIRINPKCMVMYVIGININENGLSHNIIIIITRIKLDRWVKGKQLYGVHVSYRYVCRYVLLESYGVLLLLSIALLLFGSVLFCCCCCCCCVMLGCVVFVFVETLKSLYGQNTTCRILNIHLLHLYIQVTNILRTNFIVYLLVLFNCIYKASFNNTLIASF